MKLFEHQETERTLERLPEMPPDVEVPDDISGLRRETTLRPTAGRVRWIRWIAAIVVLGAVGGLAAMILTSDDTAEDVTTVDFMEIYGTDNPEILDADAVPRSIQIVGSVDYLDRYGTDNPVFVETEAEVEDTVDYMEVYGTDNPEILDADAVPRSIEIVDYLALYGTDNPEFVEGN